MTINQDKNWAIETDEQMTQTFKLSKKNAKITKINMLLRVKVKIDKFDGKNKNYKKQKPQITLK